jgi:hypothetical protein
MPNDGMYAPPANLTPIKVLEIMLEVLQHKRIVLQQSPQQRQPFFLCTPVAH